MAIQSKQPAPIPTSPPDVGAHATPQARTKFRQLREDVADKQRQNGADAGRKGGAR